VIGLPVLYVASLRPACWITSRADCGESLLPVVYWPILKLMSWKEVHDLASRPPEGGFWDHASDGTLLRDGLFCWYAEVAAREGAHWFYTVSYERNRAEPACRTHEEWRWP
jgi:hypothetical protein